MINRYTAIAAAGLSVFVLSAIGPTTTLAQEAATITGRVTNAQGEPEATRTMGGPISGTSVGLEHDPEGRVIVSGTTDARGIAQLRQPPPGRYRVYMDTSRLVGPVRVHVTIPGSPATVSQTIAPRRGGGRAYVSTSGRRAAVFDVRRAAASGPVTIRIEAVNDAP